MSPDLDDKIFDEAEKAHSRLSDTRYFCSGCVAVAQVDQARRDGRPDPFPVFEKTLTWRDRSAVAALELHLKSGFQFKASIVPTPPGFNLPPQTMQVSAGNLTCPLTVKTYYITDARDQDRLVSLVAGFLEGKLLNQARVQFWEAESWRSWTDPKTGLTGGRRGKETLLREVILNCSPTSDATP